MREEEIKDNLKKGILRKQTPDTKRARALLESAKANGSYLASLEITPESAPIIFFEFYRAIRQIGDALWYIDGFNPQNHEISIKRITSEQIDKKIPHVDRYRRIRNKASYEGTPLSVEDAQDIKQFWLATSSKLLARAEKLLYISSI